MFLPLNLLAGLFGINFTHLPSPMNLKLPSFSFQVVLGLSLGILAGIFFGEYCKVLEPIGHVFIMLLEAFLYPFLVFSLLHGIGRLAPDIFVSLIKRGWIFYLCAWLVTIISLGILIRALPEVSPLVIDPSHVSGSSSQLLNLFFPQNIFLDFSRNFVPAVVVFSILFGLAIQIFDRKQPALDVFEAISKSSVTVWKVIIKFSPVAVFSLFANLSGTISIGQLSSLILYLLLFLIASLVLTFWVLPGSISAFIDYPITKIIKRMHEGVFMAAATMLPVTSIPYVLKLTGELAHEREINSEKGESLKETILSFSYPIMQLGNIFVYLFIGFSSFYYKHPLNIAQELFLPVLSLISTFGTPVATINSISFLSSWLDLPPGNTELYMELMTITRFFQVIATAAGLYFITIVVTFAYYGKIRLKLWRLAAHMVLPLIILSFIAFGLFAIENVRAPKRSDPYLTMPLPESVSSGVKVAVYKDEGSVNLAEDLGASSEILEGTFKRIQRTGLLRIGYNATPIPFSYFNENKELVGYDVSFAYDLARTLNVDLVFIPYTWENLIGNLKAKRFDIAISGIYVTKERLKNLSVSIPYFKSRVVMIAPSGRSKDYYSRDAMASVKGLRIGVFNDNVLQDFVRQAFPEAEVFLVSRLDEMLSFKGFDCIIWTKEQAVIFASIKSDLSVILTQDLHSPFLFAYMMPPGADEFREYINYWLDLRRNDGFNDRMKAYWFEGKTQIDPAPRWSIMRNVLHWVD